LTMITNLIMQASKNDNKDIEFELNSTVKH
jgi:hypothetical protein